MKSSRKLRKVKYTLGRSNFPNILKKNLIQITLHFQLIDRLFTLIQMLLCRHIQCIDVSSQSKQTWQIKMKFTKKKKGQRTKNFFSNFSKTAFDLSGYPCFRIKLLWFVDVNLHAQLTVENHRVPVQSKFWLANALTPFWINREQNEIFIILTQQREKRKQWWR